MTGCLGNMHMYDCIKTGGGNKAQYFCCPNKGVPLRTFLHMTAVVCAAASDSGAFFVPDNNLPQFTQPLRTGFVPQMQVQPVFLQQQQQSSSFQQSQQPSLFQQFQTLSQSQDSQPMLATSRVFSQPAQFQVQPLTFLGQSSSRSSLLPWYLRGPGSSSSTRHKRQFTTNQRWFYDALTAQCRQFDYRGAGGSPNNFETVYQCENYCKTSESMSFTICQPTACRRGSPMLAADPDGKVAQFVQRQQMCNPTSGCGDPRFECQILQPGRALCCPTVDFICSDAGGMIDRRASQGYDEGIYCANDTRTFTR